MRLTESVPRVLDGLSDEDAATLRALGRRLAGTKAWWRSSARDYVERSVIAVEPTAPGSWRVTVHNCVGVIAVGGKVIEVAPKIPPNHLLSLLAWNVVPPRTAPYDAAVESGDSFWNLLAGWMVEATEGVVRRGLLNDYRATRDALPIVRGRIDVLRTATALATGRLAVTCEFDEFDADHALNRLLLGALRVIAAAPVTATPIRVRAGRIARMFDDVSSVHPTDLAVLTDARTHYYSHAAELAKAVLTSTALSLSSGSRPAWCFLVRTPENVEEGLRQLLAALLAPEHTVVKTGLQLAGSTKTMTPDLVFDGRSAIGDVKYRLAVARDWNDADLYQVVAFATGFQARRALLLTFTKGDPSPRQLQVGRVTVTEVRWDARSTTSYADAAERCVDDVRAWLHTSIPGS